MRIIVALCSKLIRATHTALARGAPTPCCRHHNTVCAHAVVAHTPTLPCVPSCRRQFTLPLSCVAVEQCPASEEAESPAPPTVSCPDNFVCQEVSGLSHPPTSLNEGIPIKKGLPGRSSVCDKEVQGACVWGEGRRRKGGESTLAAIMQAGGRLPAIVSIA